ncbi:DUF2510 domain-containing protein [Diaminobutyricimonas aerilata]|uniref:DUF2510 domain-containing protein n=1 Tax=Diaminobutyricimonas aerilata TaxID=1162967 RepID=UPI0012FE22BD|nr:DUF2510 domain-containing protein [Diaminobutyricimonas aerilata]
MSAPELTGQPRAAWYPDPADRLRLRWWDGSRWTPHTARRATSAPLPRRRELRAPAPVLRREEPYDWAWETRRDEVAFVAAG